MKNASLTFVLTLATVGTLSTLAVGGTSPLNATGSKRRLIASADTTTSLVSEPVVQRKVESASPSGNETWVAEPSETALATLTMFIEEPIKPYLPFIAAMTSLDCNSNGIADTVEISAGAIDFDSDLIIDACEYKMGDLNLNGVIDQQDVSILVGWWGIPNPLYGDLNGDNIVDANDLGILLGRFGAVTY
ncbi:MAG: hypothetical protein ACKO3W_06805 [bacterium]